MKPLALVRGDSLEKAATARLVTRAREDALRLEMAELRRAIEALAEAVRLLRYGQVAGPHRSGGVGE